MTDILAPVLIGLAGAALVWLSVIGAQLLGLISDTRDLIRKHLRETE